MDEKRSIAIEVCAYSLESCINAQQAGAARIELCAGPGEGGTTPGTGLIRLVKSRVSLPVYAMIRPRGGDFVYDNMEIETMLAEIDEVRKTGADGVVLGALTKNGSVDLSLTRRLIEAADGLDVTFHRAFDHTPDPFEALEAIIEAGTARVLTSGLQKNVDAGMETIRKLVTAARGRIGIMAGAGVNLNNVRQLVEAGVESIHLTGKAFRSGQQEYFSETVSMAGDAPGERMVMYSDLNLLKEVVAKAGKS